eukprot:CAMPEP_0113965828 /NCGR_PEP_ID=MMETSP0011_2-20120614/7973_1 /TAXON_ID=101924 /ORGANISM="Rhodosorus marinus" /LENGTH=329 /DNA_ID=CAMNT_0000978407 /DNA_START=196 /DNA_END=1185 /DNA_ORIENTATION=- /assembly_acc=CAM_ASM_000156
MRIGTHDGAFHCDEALACYMLKKVDKFKSSPIVRTRDKATLNELECVVDVGGVYDPQTLRFDHHQRGFFETFNTVKKTKLSSAGLVYKHFGRQVIESVLDQKIADQDLETVYNKVYSSFIEEVDGVDNGIQQYDTEAPPKYEANSSLSARVGRLNPAWDDQNPDYDGCFEKAMELTGSELEDTIKSVYHSWLPGKSILLDAVEGRFKVHPSGEVILLERYCPWKSHLYAVEEELGFKTKYVIYLSANAESWRVHALGIDASSFTLRKPLPSPWRGLNDKELSAVTGIPDCVFTHMSGFIGGNRTVEGAIQMAAAAMDFSEAADEVAADS